MKVEFKESKEFKPVTLEITFETLKEMEMFADDLRSNSILDIEVLQYIEKNYKNDKNKG